MRNIYFRSDKRDEPVSIYAKTKEVFWRQRIEAGISEESIAAEWREEVKRNPRLNSL